MGWGSTFYLVTIVTGNSSFVGFLSARYCNLTTRNCCAKSRKRRREDVMLSWQKANNSRTKLRRGTGRKLFVTVQYNPPLSCPAHYSNTNFPTIACSRKHLTLNNIFVAFGHADLVDRILSKSRLQSLGPVQ